MVNWMERLAEGQRWFDIRKQGRRMEKEKRMRMFSMFAFYRHFTPGR